MEEVVILGSGITRLSVAVEVGSMGKNVLLVEKALFLRRHAALLPGKATDPCLECNACLVYDPVLAPRNTQKGYYSVLYGYSEFWKRFKDTRRK